MQRLGIIALGFGIVLVAVVGIGGCTVAMTYNSLARLTQTVAAKAAEMQTFYQMRADLVENLVETVKGGAAHERGTLTEVTQARASATGVTLTKDALNDPAAMQKFQAAQGALTGALSRLMVSVERYPDLKANQGFQDLRVRLGAIENRIALARTRYNEAVRAYNMRVTQFPGNVIAGMFGFTPKTFFEADKGATTAPKVKF